MVFNIIDQFKHSIKLTEERYAHILEHPEMKWQIERIEETIAFPLIIKESQHDPDVWCYYRWYEQTPVTKKYLLCIVRIQNKGGFIITAFYTDRIKGGKTIWGR